MSARDWEEIIQAARNGNHEAGRKILWMASFRLRDNIPLPESLREYLADILFDAAISSTSPDQDNFVGDALHIKLPIGTTPQIKKFQEALDADRFREDAYALANESGQKKEAAHVKLAAKKLGVSEKTARRRIQHYDDMLAHMGQWLGRFNNP